MVKGDVKMGMYEQFVDTNDMECRMASTPKVRSMQYRWYEIINNTVHYFQAPYNIALIVEQLSNYNVLLRKKNQNEKDEFGKQNNTIVDEHRHESNLCTTAPEHMPKTQYNKSNVNRISAYLQLIFLRSAKAKKKLQQ